MDALYLIAGLVLGAGILAAGFYFGWRVAFAVRGESAPVIIEPPFVGGSITLEPAYWPDKEPA